ncbi:MAG: hypothetical protein V7K27_26215 [Nostoc sp.]|uniref:hypothetical protein n=1 Tax=Nostoc sp. TaxID=1180 RepID=UPI002FFA2BE3
MSQFDSSKVTFPISIPLQQFFSSNFPDHYLPPALTKKAIALSPMLTIWNQEFIVCIT